MANVTGNTKFDDLAEVLPGRDDWNIKVRVLRLWKVASFMKSEETNSLEMVLADEKGGKIHASIRKQLLHMFHLKIEEGQVYQMSNFVVCPQVGMYRATLHPYKLVFQVKTKVQVAESDGITDYGFAFTECGDISAHTQDNDFLVDVIGLITGISVEREYIREGKITKMVIVEITDHSGKCECALFGEYADTLNKLMGKAAEGLPIVIIQYAKVKIFRGKASIQNVINTTRILINPKLPEVESFKDGIAVHGIELSSYVPIIGAKPVPSFEEEFLAMHPKKTIAELIDLYEEGTFAVFGSAVGFVGGHEWWYPACKCHKGVTADSGAYYCKGCARHVFQVVPRFKVNLEVSDGDATAVFLLFDSCMSYIMEKSCAHFVAAAKVENSGAYPAEFDALIGKKMLFIVDKTASSVRLSDGAFRVKRVCMNPLIIEKFCLDGPYNTPSKMISKPVPVNLDGEDGDEYGSETFVKDLIGSPPPMVMKSNTNKEIRGSVKRNLTGAFEDVAKAEAVKRLKVLKKEED